MSDEIYLDYNASQPLHKDAARAMSDAMQLVGNASSVHKFGRAARAVIDDTREELARYVGARAQDVIFTSGGTEANNLALSPSLFARAQQTEARLFVSAVEHPAVLNGMRFERDRISVIPVNKNGVVDVDWLKSALEDWRVARIAEGIDETQSLPALISVMAVNNELGVVQPIGEIAKVVHEFGGLLHSDCVQALGKIDLSINELEIDLMSVSAHKVGGPQGVGALILRGADIQLRDPLIAGGGQELKRRGGTENICGIAGFGAAIKALNDERSTYLSEMTLLRDRLESGIIEASPDAVIFGKDVLRAPNIEKLIYILSFITRSK